MASILKGEGCCVLGLLHTYWERRAWFWKR